MKSHVVISRNSGVALVVVLFVLILVATLAVAFLNLARSERSSAAIFLNTMEVRQLADNAVGIAQAQINHASTRGSTVAWASQPGMIRTYNANGTFKSAYKLYSATSLTTTNAAHLADDLPPANWAATPAEWTDLNAPVVANGTPNYPIFDPRSALNPVAAERVAGVSIQGAPGSTPDQPAPMPVRWLYVLKDGQIVAPSSVSGNTATVSQANAANPITGRIAFWTDDETCKVNLNTAGAGNFWDTPYFNSEEEIRFARRQPLNGEFQRYPGHPAMTSLKAVFPNLSDARILAITPRYQTGGSQQGTVETFTLSTALNNGILANKPLLASVDELHFLTSGTARTTNADLSSDQLQSSRFFLTATSHAPEVNLFNLPRVSCWPIATDPASRTTFDTTLALCSTINGHPYYFARQSALSPIVDATLARNTALFSYLQYFANQQVPGFGVSLAGKFGADCDQILTEIWDYIRCTNLYDSRLPADKQFTADFVPSSSSPGYGYVVPLEVGTNRGFGRSLTLSELAFQFICSADPVDTETGAGHPDPKGLKGSNDPAKNLTLGGTALGATQRRIQMMITPELFSPAFGNVVLFPATFRITISGLSSLSLAGQPLFPVDSLTYESNPSNFNTGTNRKRNGGTLDFRALLRSRVDPGLIDATGTPYPFISNFVTVPITGTPGTMAFASGQLTVTIESLDGTNWTASQIIAMTPPSSAIPVPNLVRVGTAGYSAGSTSVPATSHHDWWSFSKKSPWVGSAAGGRLFATETDTGRFTMSSGYPQVPSLTQLYPGTLIREAESATYYTDVVRSMVPSHSDFRLVAALKNVPNGVFTPLGNWSAGNTANALMHNLSTGNNYGNLIAGGTQFRRHPVTTDPIGEGSTAGSGGYMAPDFRNDATPAILSQVELTGDFDNAMGYSADGAFINKPDEGEINSDTTLTPYFGSSLTAVDSVGFFSPNRMTTGPGRFGSLPTHVRRYEADSSHPENYSWRTLLFRHQPGHPNAVTWTNGLPSAAPDHLLMDLFWMPTVEPYAISEPFATAGKINMNCQIQPFTYIERKTALYALLDAERLTAVPNSHNLDYKARPSFTPATDSFRIPFNIAETLSQFDARFVNAATTGRIFLSPTELCDLWLVPDVSGATATDAWMENYWSNHRLTGDNLRERPYADLIPRLTTKSNTYTVHFRVQLLRPRQADIWNEGSDTIAAEYRGSISIERFIDPNSSAIPDYAAAADPGAEPGLDTFYRWRVINNRTFAP
jgi:uncharacterized protein (TIGR02600 family)